jgi:hypothetical protein
MSRVAPAESFLDALTAVDLDRVRTSLHDRVWCRALLVRELIEVFDATEVVALLGQWYASPHEIEFLETQHHPMAGRDFIRYRARLRPSWAPHVWHVVEQAGYLTVKHGLITRLDLACTGFHVEKAPRSEAVDGRST